jgi:hypothetical protein
VHRRCVAVGSPSSAATVRRALRGPAELGRARCDWAERGFGPVALDLNFVFSDLFNSLQIQKFV